MLEDQHSKNPYESPQSRNESTRVPVVSAVKKRWIRWQLIPIALLAVPATSAIIAGVIAVFGMAFLIGIVIATGRTDQAIVDPQFQSIIFGGFVAGPSMFLFAGACIQTCRFLWQCRYRRAIIAAGIALLLYFAVVGSMYAIQAIRN